MNKGQLEELKKQLEVRKQELLKQLNSIGHRTEGAETNFDADFPDYGDSPEDSAVEVADYATNLSLEKELEGELHDVEKALKRTEDGSYGICKYCHKEIELDRLEIRPESNSCVACKKALKGE